MLAMTHLVASSDARVPSTAMTRCLENLKSRASGGMNDENCTCVGVNVVSRAGFPSEEAETMLRRSVAARRGL